MSEVKPVWEFDPPPPSGQRLGGDPGTAAFRVELDTFVREVVQNSLDARVTGSDLGVRLRLETYRGSDLQRFMATISWSELRPHLEGAAKQEYGRPIGAALERLQSKNELTVLYVEDSGTVGLSGPESDETGNFTALCRDELFSHKSQGTAGGSWGLGKAVLWLFSSLRTVLFVSKLAIPQEGQSLRAFGRSNLPWHRTSDDRRWTGSGWFGLASKDEPSPRSFWGSSSATFARDLGIDLERASGTTIMVLGFREPAAEEDRPLRDICDDLASASAKYFWPAMAMSAGVSIEIGGSGSFTQVLPQAAPEVTPFVTALERCRRGEGVERPEKPNDVATVEIPVRIPGRKDGAAAHEGFVTLLVRLADESRDDLVLKNHIASFRSLGMVLNYRGHPGKGLMTQAFHAVLLAGLAAKAPDKSIDEWLRAAETAEHDKWTATERLVQFYKQGSQAALKALQQAVDTEITRLVTISSSDTTTGADELRKLFPFGQPHDGPPGGEEFFLEGVQTSRDSKGGWTVRGTFSSRRRRPKGWTGRLSFALAGEDGVTTPLQPEKATLSAGTAQLGQRELVIRIPPRGPQKVDFEVRTSAIGLLMSQAALRFAPLMLDAVGEAPNA